MKPITAKSIFFFFLISTSQVIASESFQTTDPSNTVEADLTSNLSLADFFRNLYPDFRGEIIIPLLAKENDIEGLEVLAENGLVVTGTVYNDLDSSRKKQVVNVEAFDCSGCNALHAAAFNGNLEILSLLLNLGANVNAITRHGRLSVVQIAIKKGHLEVVQMLISRGANVHANPLTLHRITDFQREIFEILVNAGFNMNSVDRWGETALSIALRHRRTDFALKLLESGSIYRPELHSDQSLLNLAFSHESAELMRFAVENGDDINEVDIYGDTLLHRIMGIQKHPDWLKLLIDLGANIDVQNNYLETPLHLAVKSNDSAMVIILVNNGANANARDSSGQIPLHRNYKHGHESSRTIIERCLRDHDSI